LCNTAVMLASAGGIEFFGGRLSRSSSH